MYEGPKHYTWPRLELLSLPLEGVGGYQTVPSFVLSSIGMKMVCANMLLRPAFDLVEVKMER